MISIDGQHMNREKSARVVAVNTVPTQSHAEIDTTDEEAEAEEQADIDDSEILADLPDDTEASLGILTCSSLQTYSVYGTFYRRSISFIHASVLLAASDCQGSHNSRSYAYDRTTSPH